MIIYTRMHMLNQKTRRTGIVEVKRTREEMAAAIFADKDDFCYLFWHLQVARYAALDSGDTAGDWLRLLNTALDALRRKDRKTLKATIYKIDQDFNDGREAEAERIRKAAGLQ